MSDAAERLALAKAIHLSADVEAALRNHERSGPLLYLLNQARQRAAEAMIGLVVVSAEDPPEIRRLQNDVVGFELMCGWLKDAIGAGIEADRALSDGEHADILEATDLSPEVLAEMARLGLTVGNNEQGDDA